MDKNKTALTVCKVTIVLLAIGLGLAFAVGRQCILADNLLGMMLAGAFAGVDLWLALGCFSILRRSASDISDQ